MTAARWTEAVDVVTQFTAWQDEELFRAWVHRIRVCLGQAPEPVTGETKPPPDPSAPRGVYIQRVRELVTAVAEAYRALDVPAPADPEFCWRFFGATFREFTAPGETTPPDDPPPRFEDSDTPAERAGALARHEVRRLRRAAEARSRDWSSAWDGPGGVRYEPAYADAVYRVAIVWDGSIAWGGLDQPADAWLESTERSEAALIPGAPAIGERWPRATPAGRSGPWTGRHMFIGRTCERRPGFGDCKGWRNHILPAPMQEWAFWSEIGNMLAARSATDVQRDAWRWIAARNVAELQWSGLASSEVRDLIGRADIEAQEIQQENQLRDAAHWINVVGSTAMAAGPYGAIIGTVLKAIATILDAIPMAYGYDVDAWGRRRPVFSTWRISGAPSRAPTHAVQTPPGFTRQQRGRLRIIYPAGAPSTFRVRVDGGVWRPSGWEDDVLPGLHDIEVEQPGAIPARRTERVTANELTTVRLSPLARPQTERERRAIMEAEKIRAEKEREQATADARRRAEERERKRREEEGTHKPPPGKPGPIPDAIGPQEAPPEHVPEAPPPGAIVIEAPRGAPPGARVRVLSTDGARELLPWSTPPVSLAAAPGTYRVEWAEAGQTPAAREVVVVSLARVAVNLWASRGRVREIARKVGTVVAAAGVASVAVYAVRRYQRGTASGAPNAPR